MKKRMIFAMMVVCLVFAAAGVVTAQEQGPKPTLTHVYVATPIPGQGVQFEAGLKKHFEWHKAQKDSWSWNTYMIMTGPATGSYVAVTGGHQWADYDAHANIAAGDGANAQVTIGPHTQSMTSHIWQTMPNVSAVASPQTQASPRMMEVIHFQVKMGMDLEFNHAMARVHEAIKKTKWGTTYTWFVLINGGDGGRYALVLPKNKWAEMEEPTPPFPVMLQQGLGGAEAARVMKLLDECVKSVWSEMLVHRPDLSYTPGN